MKTVEKIQETQKENETIYTHPSFGCVTISKIHGSRPNFFGSDLHHSDFYALRISTAEMRRPRDLSYETILNKKQLIEIFLTPNQFIEMITQMNQGCGIPCTIDYVQGTEIPTFDNQKLQNVKFEEELEKFDPEIHNRFNELTEAVKELKISEKIKQELLRKISTLNMRISEKLPYMFQRFKETMEKLTTEGKIAIESFWTSTLMRLGLSKLKENNQLEDQRDTSNPPSQIK